jgi:hypothetical protein
MFVLRSAFWLTIGFLIVAPHGAADLGATATALKDEAVTAGLAAGQRLIVSQIAAPDRLPDFLLSAASVPSADRPMQVSPSSQIVVPRPRPPALG